MAGTIDVLGQLTLGHVAVIEEGVDGRRRHRIDRVRADQRLDVEHVRILRVLGAGARPQDPLWAGALCGHIGKRVRLEDLLIPLICKLGVGDCSFAPLRHGLIGAVLLQSIVCARVDTTDEERSNRSDAMGLLCAA